MTKAEIVEKVYDATGLSKKNCFGLVEQVFEVLKQTLESGENIKISGFGNFGVREKADRRGRNPQTGAEIVVEARKVVAFKASMVLKERIKYGAWLSSELIELMDKTETDMTKARDSYQKRIAEISHIYMKATDRPISDDKLLEIHRALKQAGPGPHTEVEQINIIQNYEAMNNTKKQIKA